MGMLRFWSQRLLKGPSGLAIELVRRIFLIPLLPIHNTAPLRKVYIIQMI